MEGAMRYACLFAFLLVGCASDDEDTGPPRIEATVSYAGSTQGTLVVAAFATNPPMGGPKAVAQKASPSFPVMLTLDAVQPGDKLYVFAELDVAPSSPMMPGPEDRSAWAKDMDVVADAGATAVTLTLTD